jgi:rRNA-processing protein FCF1
MKPLQLHLKQGADPERAIDSLAECANAARNLSGEISRGPITPAADADYMMARRDRYLTWVEATEGQLSNFTDDLDVRAMLETTAYWEVRQLIPLSPRPISLIDSEISRQIGNLEGLRDGLSRRRDRARAAPGHIVVVDTNALLHYQLPDSIDWPAIVGEPEVRLVLPLRVIEELDAKKYTDSEKVRRKARELLPKLRSFVGGGGTPKAVRDDTTIEVYIEPGPRSRPSDADTEILETAHELHNLSGKAVTIATADTGMALRGETEGIPTLSMPEEYRRD